MRQTFDAVRSRRQRTAKQRSFVSSRLVRNDEVSFLPWALLITTWALTATCACDARKNELDASRAEVGAHNTGRTKQAFPDNPALQRLVEAGAIIGVRPATRNVRSARSVKFSGAIISDDVLAPLRRINNLWRVSFHDCNFNPGALRSFPRSGGPIALDFQHCNLPPGTLHDLDKSAAVGNLMFWHDTPVDDALLSELSGFPKLFRFQVSSADVSAEGLMFLAKCPHLSELLIDRTTLDDAGLVQVAAGHNLTWLDIAETKITNVGMPTVAALTELRRLRIAGCEVTDIGIAHIAGLNKLSALDLGGTQITDDGLAAISGLSAIQDLGLEYTSVTNAGLKHLGGLRQLMSIDNRGAAINSDGVTRAFGRTVTLIQQGQPNGKK